MSIFHKAKGGTSFGLFLIRFSVGLFFLIAGLEKITNLEAFVGHVKSMNILSENLSFIFGFTLPFVEVFFGLMYIIGLFTPITSFVLALINISILIAVGVAPENLPFSFNIILLAINIATIFTGAGSLSIDVFFDKKKGRQITISPETPKEAPAEPIKPEIKDANFTNIDH
jgi:uncharacterized membrane protein YphA (DoxX/SURF4 family)